LLFLGIDFTFVRFSSEFEQSTPVLTAAIAIVFGCTFYI
jgi:hypothetical protein